MKFDLKNFDPTKIDIHDLRTLRVLTAIFISLILCADIAYFCSIQEQIKEAKNQRDKDISDREFVEALINKKDKLVAVSLYPHDKIDDLIDKIYSLAEHNKIVLGVSNSIGNEKETSGSFGRKLITMDASGSLKDLAAFLTAIRDLPEAVLQIRSMNLARLSKDHGSIKARLTYILFTTKE